MKGSKAISFVSNVMIILSEQIIVKILIFCVHIKRIPRVFFANKQDVG